LYRLTDGGDVTMPARSLDQRLSALQRANETRFARSQLKKELATGICRIDQLLAEVPELARGAKVSELLLAVPKLGRVRVSRLMRQCRISEAKTLAGLSERQRAELIAYLRR
jgi:hypothetical protein